MRRNRFTIRGFVLLAVALIMFGVVGLALFRGFIRVGPSGLPKRYVTRAEDPAVFWRNVAFPAVAGTVLAAFADFNFRLGRREAGRLRTRQPAGPGVDPREP
jgi:hypothetical protein